MDDMVGPTGLEPAASASRTQRSTRLSYGPTNKLTVLGLVSPVKIQGFLLDFGSFRFGKFFAVLSRASDPLDDVFGDYVALASPAFYGEPGKVEWYFQFPQPRNWFVIYFNKRTFWLGLID